MLIWKIHPLHLAILTFALLNLNQLSAGQSNSLMDVSQDGKRIAVANTDSGTVTVFDVKSRSPPCGNPRWNKTRRCHMDREKPPTCSNALFRRQSRDY